jgi:2-polyprenyl-3-methyl-5-hydroxy-6-metoxy-1,4-benzoquinol methylase
LKGESTVLANAAPLQSVAGYMQMLHTGSMRIYERLSHVYDIGWCRFAEQYTSLVNQLLGEYGITHARILDLACGTGILAISLASQGHTVHGIDISPEMVAVAKSKSVGIPRVSFEVGDMTEFVVRGKFDLITCTFDSLNYVLNTDGVRAMFGRIARSLMKSGLFVFDSNTSQHYINVGNGSRMTELAGQSFVHTWSYDSTKKEATTTFEFADGPGEIHRQQPYDLSQLNPILAEAGLRTVHTWSGFDRSPYNAQSPRLFCVAQKNA